MQQYPAKRLHQRCWLETSACCEVIMLHAFLCLGRLQAATAPPDAALQARNHADHTSNNWTAASTWSASARHALLCTATQH
jgi:hypothetical protein